METGSVSSSLDFDFADQTAGLAGDNECPSSRPQEAEEGQLAATLKVETLEKLYTAIKERDNDGTCPITPNIFVDTLQSSQVVDEDEARRLFEKIDWVSMKRVSWSQFCTFMSMELQIQDRHAEIQKEVKFVLPAPISPLPHLYRNFTIRVLATVDGLWITVSSSATLSLWDNRARLKRHKICQSKPSMKKKMQKQWITDALLMTEFSKVILTTGNREIQFYDMASFTPFCQIKGLESIPLCTDYKWLKGDKCLITYGDQMGCISVLIMHCPWKSFRLWKKLPKHEDFIASIPIEQTILENHVSFMRWQVHKDWVSMVQYHMETDHIVSCSKDPVAALVVGNRRGSTNAAKALKDVDVKSKRALYACTRPRQSFDQIVFSIARGATVFDYSPQLKMVATGGCDRTIRLWNCYVNKKPIAVLLGHYGVIRYAQLCHHKQRLYSASADNWIKVWDLLEYSCLLTLPWHLLLVPGDLRCIRFSSVSNSVAVVGDNDIAILRLKSEDDLMICHSHDHPVKCIAFNSVFNQIISACSGSTVKTWSLETGRMEVEFLDAHERHAINDITLDSAMKRLVTVATDGTAKMWNYNTGLCVRTLQPAPGSLELTTATYIDMRNVKYILTGGWNHRLNLYIDDTPETIPFEVPLIPSWRDDLVRGHQSDILCSDFSQRDKAATGDYEGQVMVWNVETGYRVNVLRPPPPEGWSQEKLEDDRGVTCLHFLKLRSRLRRGGNLVVGGPYGQVSIWNINFTKMASSAMAIFPVSEYNTDKEVVSVTALDSDANNSVLVTGDSRGCVALWDLQTYTLDHHEDQPPTRLATWMAHALRVTGVKVATERLLVVSCSTDRTVRVWTRQGHYIGTFGQKLDWTVGDETTYQHPRIPKDIEDLTRQSQLHVQQDTGQVEEDEEQGARSWRDGGDPFATGLNYFARKKAVLSKKGRHLNDEDLSVYSCTGGVVPYQSLRQYPMQDSPPALPDDLKAGTTSSATKATRRSTLADIASDFSGP